MLIKSLMYFAELTGSGCIAEGMDSEKKLEILRGQGGRGVLGESLLHPERPGLSKADSPVVTVMIIIYS